MTKSSQIDHPAFISAQDVEDVLAGDLNATKETVAKHFNGEIASLVLGGSFARGEGCLWYKDGKWVPGNNLNFFLISKAKLDDEELRSVREDVLAHTLVGSIDIVPLIKSDLPTLPLTVPHVDLKAGHRTIAGDPAAIDLLPEYETVRLPRFEAEIILRKRLVTLLEAYPIGIPSYRSYYLTAKAIFAGVDALLIRQHSYETSYRHKVEHFRVRVSDPHLLQLVQCALKVKLGIDIDFEYSPSAFWRRAVRFLMDSLLGIFQVRAPFRSNRLKKLLDNFHRRSTSRSETLKRMSLNLLRLNSLGHLERFLLALLINADGESAVVDLIPLARRAGLPPVATWEAYLPLAIAAWRKHAAAR